MYCTMRTTLFALVGMVLACASSTSDQVIPNRSSVRVDREMDRGLYRYRVEGASGRTQSAATDQALAAALQTAAKQVAGDPRQKTAAVNCVRDAPGTYAGLTSPGTIFKRAMRDDRLHIDMYVTVRVDDLSEALRTCGITQASDMQHDVGRPTMMVVSRSARCDDRSTSEWCALERRIDGALSEVSAAESALRGHTEQILATSCLRSESTKMEVRETLEEDHRAARAGLRTTTEFAVAERERVRLNAESNELIEELRPSSNCQAFVGLIRAAERRLAEARARLRDHEARQLALVRGGLAWEATTTRINQYLVDERWRVVDEQAVENARRMQRALANTSGMSDDPIARLAQLAGSDIYLEFGTSEIRTGGGFQVELDIRAFDVVSGELLASRAAKSRLLADEDPSKAIAEASGKAMPVVMDQIMGYWSDVIRDGARSKLLLRGEFGSRKVELVRALDEVIGQVPGCRRTSCVFELGHATNQSIEGAFIVPPKSRSRLGLTLEDVFGRLGIEADLIITNSAMHLVQVM